MPVVKLYANLRSVTGKSEINLPASSIHELLDRLIHDFPDLQRFLLENGKLRPRVIITLNGQPLDPAAGQEIPVADQDQVAIFPPVAGG